jgi:hypothetical protein
MPWLRSPSKRQSAPDFDPGAFRIAISRRRSGALSISPQLRRTFHRIQPIFPRLSASRCQRRWYEATFLQVSQARLCSPSSVCRRPRFLLASSGSPSAECSARYRAPMARVTAKSRWSPWLHSMATSLSLLLHRRDQLDSHAGHPATADYDEWRDCDKVELPPTHLPPAFSRNHLLIHPANPKVDTCATRTSISSLRSKHPRPR